MPKTKNIMQKPMIKEFTRITNDKRINRIAVNKNAHKNICGIFIIDSKNIPATNERQRKNNIFDALILLGKL
jgi:hypothetical protein